MTKPNSTAFFANKPAPINTFGFEVFVHEVIAAIKIEPSFISKEVSLTFTEFCLSFFVVSLNIFVI